MIDEKGEKVSTRT